MSLDVILRPVRYLEGFYAGKRTFESLFLLLYKKWIGKQQKLKLVANLEPIALVQVSSNWPATSLLGTA